VYLRVVICPAVHTQVSNFGEVGLAFQRQRRALKLAGFVGRARVGPAHIPCRSGGHSCVVCCFVPGVIPVSCQGSFLSRLLSRSRVMPFWRVKLRGMPVAYWHRFRVCSCQEWVSFLFAYMGMGISGNELGLPDYRKWRPLSTNPNPKNRRTERIVMKKLLTPVLALVLTCSLSFAQAAQGGRANQKQDTTKTEKKKGTTEAQAAICKMDIANKSMQLLPWDSASASWKRDATKTVFWEDTTELISGATKITMAQLANGTELDATVTTLKDIQREECVFQLQRVGDKEIIRSAERVTLFAGQQRAGRVGMGPDGRPQFIPIGDGKIHVCDDIK